MGFAHSLVTSGELITEWLPTFGFRLELPDDYERALSFTEGDAPQDGAPATDFDVRFTTRKATSFKFDENDGLYYVSQYDGAYIDGNDNTQVAVTNVLILHTSVSLIQGDTSGRLNVRTTGNGAGYFVSDGKYIEIEWSRENDSSQFIYTLPDGTPLTLRQGRTYICIIPNSMEVTFDEVEEAESD